MFKSYLKTAVRFLLKNKTFSLINILGLTLGTLCCLYIVLYVTDQYSYDKQHAGVQNIYRVDEHAIAKARGYEGDQATTVAPVPALMKHDFPEVEQFTRVVPFLGVDKQLLKYNNKSFYETDAIFVDSTFFDIFSFHFVTGNPATALQQPYSVVLLKPTAVKLFGKENPIGKSITIDNVNGKHDYTVQAVIDESLGKSHIHANIFITMNSGDVGDYMLHTDNWISNSYVSSYVKLKPNTNIALLQKKFPAFVNRYGGQQLQKWGIEERLFLQNVTTIHTTADLQGPQITKSVSPSFLTMLSLIAVLIQVIACINFMNLSTARASKRAKEVGIRKVIGAGKKDLVKQFIGESLLLSLIGVLLALPLLLLLMPYLNQLTQANIDYTFLAGYKIWLTLAAMVVITGLIAGSYPAFYLSAFRAIKVLKGNFTNNVSAVGLRRSLVVFQFVLSIVLITGIIVIYSQLSYIKNKDLGFDKDQRLVFSLYSGDGFDKLPLFVDDLRKLAEVKEASDASKYLGNDSYFNNIFLLKGQTEAGGTPSANFIIADEYFIRANGIQILSGRDFRPTDSAKVLINETLVKKLGLTAATAVGVQLHDSQNRIEEVIGVMKDFNFGSLHSEVSSFLLWINNAHYGYWPYITVHTNTADYKGMLAKMEALWHKDIPGVPFDYTFLDEHVQKLYEADASLSRIITSFTLMAIFISSLGLFGLAAFSAEQRRKEISIRKVLGASVSGIAQLLSQEFLKLVIVAFLIATPVAWWAMHTWLQAFAYKVTLSWWMFGMGGFFAIFIALVTVSFQAIKAAVANPVRALKAE